MRAGVVVVVALVAAIAPAAAEAAKFRKAYVTGNRGYRSWFQAYPGEANKVKFKLDRTGDTVQDLGAVVVSPLHEVTLDNPTGNLNPDSQPTLDTCTYLVVSATCQRDQAWGWGPIIRLLDGDDTIEVTFAAEGATGTVAPPWAHIDLGSGQDRVLGGVGSDDIEAVDGEVDHVDCGPGNDQADVDPADVVLGCETVRVIG
jgi:hypothetical protein